MRVVIITQEIPFYIPEMLDRTLETVDSEVDVRAVVGLEPVETRRPLDSLRYYARFWGLRALARFGMKFLTAKLLDPIRGKNSVARVTKSLSIPYASTPDVNEPEFIEWLEDQGADLVVSVASNQIFGSRLLSTPARGCINVHASLLPEYRGFNPSFWALKNQENQTGVTVHRMTEELDVGDIIKQEKIPIKPGESWHSLQKRVAARGATCLSEAILAIADGTVEPLSMTPSEGSLFQRPSAEDGKAFRESGGRFI